MIWWYSRCFFTLILKKIIKPNHLLLALSRTFWYPFFHCLCLDFPLKSSNIFFGPSYVSLSNFFPFWLILLIFPPSFISFVAINRFTIFVNYFCSQSRTKIAIATCFATFILPRAITLSLQSYIFAKNPFLTTSWPCEGLQYHQYICSSMSLL